MQQLPDDKRIAELMLKYLQDSLTVQEAEELEYWKNSNADHSLLFTQIVDAEAVRKGVAELDAVNRVVRERLAAEGLVMKNTDTTPAVTRRLYWVGWAAAACVLAAVAVFSVQQWKGADQPGHGAQSRVHIPVVIPPGKSGAVLTLSDGSQVVLDTMQNGVITMQNGSRLVLKDSGLSYALSGKSTGETAYNTITTPNGRHFQITLSDGSKVWLNASSSLRYPTAFQGKERKVEIKGEAFFEVKPNAAMPFRVMVNGREEVEVLGTSFNISAYEEDETVRTTLIDGAVAVKKEGKKLVLKPGQQAEVKKTESAIKVAAVQTEPVVAWRYGFFNFQGATLEEVMKQLIRWYDIEVVYEKGIPDIRFGGEMSRNITLEGVLRALEASEVNFRLEGNRTLVIAP